MSKQTLFAPILLLCSAVCAQNDPDLLGRINGEPIRWSDFLRYEQQIYANSDANRYRIRAQIWNYFVESVLVRQEAARIGLDVPEEEMEDLQFGYHLSPIIQDRFRGPDGRVNYAQLQQIRYAIASGNFPAEYQAYWAVQKAEIEKERLQSKMTALLTKGCYTPTWQAEMAFRETNEEIDIQYVKIPFDRIADPATAPADAELTAFTDQFPRLYYQEEERRILDYWLFPVQASAADSAAVLRELTGLVPAFKKADNDSLFAAEHGGIGYDDYRRAADLPQSVAAQLLRARPGTVVGPFLEAGVWAIAKVMDKKALPDSVRCRHLMLRDDSPDAEKQIDKWIAQLRAGKARFGELARQFSEDPGSADKGGELGWIYAGQTVPEFNEICFYDGKPGRFYKVKTQFGWHIVEITDRKFLTKQPSVRLAVISREIVASPQTEQKVRARAEKIFAGAADLTALEAAAAREGLSLMRGNPLTVNDFSLPGLNDAGQSRAAVRAAFAPGVAAGGLLPEVFRFEHPDYPVATHFGIFGLRQVIPPGPASAATLRSFPGLVSQAVSRKKADAIIAQTRPADGLDQIAAQWGVPVETATSRFWSPFLRAKTTAKPPVYAPATTSPVAVYTWSTDTAMANYSPSDITVTSYLPADPPASAEPFWAPPDALRVVGRAFFVEENVLAGPVAGIDGVYYFEKTTQSRIAPPADLRLFQRQISSVAVAAVRLNWLRDMKIRANIEDFRSRFF